LIATCARPTLCWIPENILELGSELFLFFYYARVISTLPNHAHPATLTEPHSLLLVAAESVASRLVESPGPELEHGQNVGLRALNLDVTDALAIARQVEDDVAQLLQAFSS